MADLGVSFVPNAQGGNPDKIKNGANVNPIQQAIKFLSLRLPARISGAPIAPQALLQGAGGAGLPSVDSVVAQIMRRIAPTAAPGAAPQAPVAAPVVPQQMAAQAPSRPAPEAPAPTGMQAPPASFSVTSPTQGVLAKSPFARETPAPISPMTSAAPTPRVIPAVAPTHAPVPKIPTRPNQLPQEPPDYEGREWPAGQPLPPPDTTPSVEPESAPPSAAGPSAPPLSEDMQDLLDMIRRKYSGGGYGETYEG